MSSIKQGVVVPISGNVRLPVGLCLRGDTRSRIESRYPAMFAQYSVDDYIRLLDDTQQGVSMFATSPRVTAFWNIVLDAWGANGLEAFNRVTMLALIESFEERAVPTTIRPLFSNSSGSVSAVSRGILNMASPGPTSTPAITSSRTFQSAARSRFPAVVPGLSTATVASPGACCLKGALGSSSGWPTSTCSLPGGTGLFTCHIFTTS